MNSLYVFTLKFHMFGKYRLSVGRLFSDTLESGRLENIREKITQNPGMDPGGRGVLIGSCLWFGV